MANVRHPRTGYISQQLHLVFDDLFETVISQGDDYSIIEAICSDIFDISQYWYAKEEFDNYGNKIYLPPSLNNVWIDEWGRHDWK